MMNGMEQSDLAIVPMRVANKGTSVPAEPTEGRAGTKGNPRGQCTHRTQRRARVTQAAERIRQAATRKPKEKLTALLHHITTEALDAAYFSLKKEAAAGVDGVTWHEYGKGLAERLSALHDRVRSGAYRALPSRRVSVLAASALAGASRELRDRQRLRRELHHETGRALRSSGWSQVICGLRKDEWLELIEKEGLSWRRAAEILRTLDLNFGRLTLPVNDHAEMPSERGADRR